MTRELLDQPAINEAHISNLQLADMLTELKELLTMLSKPTQVALTYEQVGDLLGVSDSTVRRFEKQPSFPKARKYQTDDDSRPVTRFIADEIYHWIKRKPL